MPLTIGSRQSHLAKFQAFAVEAALKESGPSLELEFFFKPSLGDLNLDMDLSKTQSKGVFTADFLELLQNKKCDMVVHSWKDLPIENNGLTEVVGTLPREDSRDLLFIKKSALKNKSLKILTSSPRREFNIKNFFNYLNSEVEISYKEIRGNIPTRFSKFLKDEEADGFSVAVAAVRRLVSCDEFNADYPGIWAQLLEQSKWCVLPESLCPSAPAQGALAIEILQENKEALSAIQKINDKITKECIEEERSILKKYGGGCHLALGATVLRNSYGKLVFEAGCVEGKTIKNVTFCPDKKYPDIDVESLWLSSEEATSIRKPVEGVHMPQGLRDLVVTRAEALPHYLHSHENDNIFVSGLKTWKKLYDQGYWACGSLDSLGEDYFISDLFKEKRVSYWLTREGIEGPAKFQTVETYSLQAEVDPKTFEKRSGFVWMSGELFIESLQSYKELYDRPHFLAMGRSMERAKKKLEELEIKVDLYPFYNLEQLKQSLKK